MSPTIFAIYIDKIEECLEFVGCDGPKLVGIVITLLLYADDIILLAKIHDYLDKYLKALHVYYSKMGMAVNINKTKFMIIKSKKITHGSLVYDKHNLEHISSYKYLGIDITHQLKWNYNIEKRIIESSKSYYDLENNCKLVDIFILSKKGSSLRFSSPLFSL